MSFVDRKEAGRALAGSLIDYKRTDTIVLGLPRGGVPVAYEVAVALETPLDVWVVRKVGAPMQPELGMGAVAEGGGLYLDKATMGMVGTSRDEIARLVEEKTREVQQRVRLFRAGHLPPALRGKTVILVDDGIATGGTVRAAISAIRRLEPRRIVLAVPVAAAQTLEEIRVEVDDVVCLIAPSDLWAIGDWYTDFRQVSDDEVIELLDAARRRGIAARSSSHGAAMASPASAHASR